MKKILLCLTLIHLICMSTFAQATSLTIDNQTPGWLSSKINYGDQLTLENLIVTGYLNGSDIKFIRELNINRNLSGVISLEYANIVSGGESYGKFGSSSFETKDSIITDYIFADLKPIRKVVLPKSVKGFDQDYTGKAHQFDNTSVDTLVINGSMKSLRIGDGKWKTRCIYFPEEVENLNLGHIFDSSSGLTNIEIFLPTALEKVTASPYCIQESTIFHCNSTTPENILATNEVHEYGHYNQIFQKGTIYVPKGTKEAYEHSIFNRLNIIEDIPVEGLMLESQLMTFVGEEKQITAEIIPADALNKNIKWESSNPQIAIINDEGIITPLTFGNTEIVGTTEDGGFSDTCTVYVFEHTTGIEMLDNLSISVGKQFELNAKTIPLGTSDGIITYSTSDNNIAAVSDAGIIIGKARGTCTIKATTVDGGYTAECVVTVLQPVESVTLEKHSLSMKVGETENLYVQVGPANADNKDITWSSSDEQLATVDSSGEVHALKAGSVWLKVVSVDNPEAKDSCKITITQPVTGIQLDITSYQLSRIGDSFELNASVIPEDSSNKNVKWSSTNEAVCIVSNGVVVAVGEGISVIIATTEDGGFIATCTVTVDTSSKISSIVFDENKSFQVLDPNGVMRTNIRKGVNLIRFADGTVKKVIIK